MSLKHQSLGSFNSSSSSRYSSCTFACYTDLRKLVGKRSLKPHKAVLFLSLQFNQNRHRSNTNPQLNFLQAKYWTKKKKQDRGKHLWQQAHQWLTFCICIFTNLICQIWFLYVSPPEELIYHIKSTHCKSRRTMTVFISGEREERERQILQRAALICCTALEFFWPVSH